MENKILQWLEKSGYPLELFAQNILASKGFECGKSELYEDEQSGISREIDVVGYKEDYKSDAFCTALRFIVECKKSEKPLLILADKDSTDSRFNHFFNARTVNMNKPITNDNIIFEVLMFNRKLPNENNPKLSTLNGQVMVGYSVVPAFTTSDANIYGGLLGLAKCEKFYENKMTEFFEHWSSDELSESDAGIVEIAYPILLVDAPLYYVFLDSDNQLVLEETKWGTVTINLPWNVDDRSDRKSNIQVVTKNSFSGVVDAIGKLQDEFFDPNILHSIVENFSA